MSRGSSDPVDTPPDPVGVALEEAIVRYGDVLTREPRRLRAFLTDVAGEHRAQISSLLLAVDEGIPDALLDAPNGSECTVAARLVEALTRERGLDPRLSRWAVHAWARALGRDVDPTGADAGGGEDHLPAGAARWVGRGWVSAEESFGDFESIFAIRGDVHREEGAVHLAGAGDHPARIAASRHPIRRGAGAVARLTLGDSGTAGVGLAAGSADQPLGCLLLRPGATATVMRRSGGSGVFQYRHSALGLPVHPSGTYHVFWGRQDTFRVAVWDPALADTGAGRSLTLGTVGPLQACHLYVEMASGELRVDQILWLEHVGAAG